MKVVLTNGCFDILHAGHVQFLQAARMLGDFLHVCINNDQSVMRLKGKGRPINRERDRAAVLRSVRWVDSVLLFDTEHHLERIIESIKPDILVKSGYSEDQITGAEIVRGYGGEVITWPRTKGQSTTEIISRCVGYALDQS